MTDQAVAPPSQDPKALHTRQGPPFPVATNEPSVIDERCWIRCKQTKKARWATRPKPYGSIRTEKGIRRIAGQEPICRATCYMDFGKQFATIYRKDSPHPELRAKAPELELAYPLRPQYRPSWLDGKYIFKFTGSPTIIMQHMQTMKHSPLRVILYYDNLKVALIRLRKEAIAKRKAQLQSEAAPGTITIIRLEKSLTQNQFFSLAEVVQKPPSWIHFQMERMSGPALRNIQRLPKLVAENPFGLVTRLQQNIEDGRVRQFLGKIYVVTLANLKKAGARLRERLTGGNNHGPNDS